MATPQNTQCRLCNSQLVPRFSAKILRKFDIHYFGCSQCESLQTETPYWLDEAYAETRFNLDVGAVQRNLDNFAFVHAFSRLFNVQTAIDFGARDGLLCRFLRDHGIDCYAYDKYATPMYALDFAQWPGGRPGMLTAFEVFEHLPNPASDLDELFGYDPDYMLVSTEIYAGQGADWWYLSRESGQHVFFYGPNAIRMIAQKYNYGVTQIGGFLLFFKPAMPFVQERIIAAQHALTGWIFQAIKSYTFLMPTEGVDRDFKAVVAKAALMPPA